MFSLRTASAAAAIIITSNKLLPVDACQHQQSPQHPDQQTKRKGPDRQLVWNFPLEATFKATNAFGWPQLVLSVYGPDALGRDVIKGYGSVHLPTRAGRYMLTARLYRPRSASPLRAFVSWLTGMPAEFADPRFPSYGAGREGARAGLQRGLVGRGGWRGMKRGVVGRQQEREPWSRLCKQGKRRLPRHHLDGCLTRAHILPLTLLPPAHAYVCTQSRASCRAARS